MVLKVFSFIILGLIFHMQIPQDFFEEQLKYNRVASAHKNKKTSIESQFASKNISFNNFDMYLRAFKLEKKLEVWIKSKNETKYTYLKEYDFCKSSGKLGPKRKEGDLQIPEGIYEVEYFNPESTFHLSFKINYPNASDKILSDKQKPGNDIFIHGKCETVGCIPLGDDAIEELYLIAIKAKSLTGKIPVHIFPAKLNQTLINSLAKEFPGNARFWEQLQVPFKYFEKYKMLPSVKVSDNGSYTLGV